jgi:serine/threonine protein kinase
VSQRNIVASRTSTISALSLAEAAVILLDVVAGLEAMHSLDVVHRDLKPANILKGTERYVVADFGLAKDLADPDQDLTGAAGVAGSFRGTPRYTSPEQASGRQATNASDLYSLGVILYEMLAARPPYEGTSEQLLVAHRTGAPNWTMPGLSGPQLPILQRLLAKEPDKRGTAALLRSELQRVVHAPLGVPTASLTTELPSQADAPSGDRPRGAQATIKVEFADPESRRMLGTSLRIESVDLILPPLPRIQDLLPDPGRIAALPLARRVRYVKDYAEYLRDSARYNPVVLLAHNVSDNVARDVTVDFELDASSIAASEDAPTKPDPLALIPRLGFRSTPGEPVIEVEARGDSVLIRFRAGKVQPGAVAHSPRFFLAALRSEHLQMHGTVYSDEGPPTGVNLELDLQYDRRDIGADELARILGAKQA